MPSLLMKADDHLKPLARLPGNERLGFGTGRTTSPMLARFDPWSAMGGIAIVIDFLGCLARGAKKLSRTITAFHFTGYGVTQFSFSADFPA
jgi:hypothetical protein